MTKAHMSKNIIFFILKPLTNCNHSYNLGKLSRITENRQREAAVTAAICNVDPVLWSRATQNKDVFCILNGVIVIFWRFLKLQHYR